MDSELLVGGDILFHRTKLNDYFSCKEEQVIDDNIEQEKFISEGCPNYYYAG